MLWRSHGDKCCFSRGLCLTGSSRDPIIVCSPCHVAEEFSGLITLLFPDNQTADTWSFEVLGSRDTAGRYTCHGGQWRETFQSLPCSIPFTLEDTASNTASINTTKGEFSSLDVQIQTHTCRLTSITQDLTSVRKVNDNSFSISVMARIHEAKHRITFVIVRKNTKDKKYSKQIGKCRK